MMHFTTRYNGRSLCEKATYCDDGIIIEMTADPEESVDEINGIYAIDITGIPTISKADAEQLAIKLVSILKGFCHG